MIYWRRATRTAALLAVAAIAQPATIGGASAQTAPTGNAVIAVTSLPNVGQDLLQVLELPSRVYWNEVFDYPIEQNAEGDLIPGLATSWTSSDDGLVWTFNIREGVKFHNGDTMTAEDVAWGWDRLFFSPDSKHSFAGFAPDVESITAEGNTVVIRTKVPMAYLPLSLAQTDGSVGGIVQSKAYFEAVGPEEASRHPIGTGPYKFVSSTGDETVELAAFVDEGRSNWQVARTPGFETVMIRAVPDVSTRVALLKTGAADLIELSIAALGDVDEEGLRMVTVPSSNYSGMLCIGFTLNPDSPCNDVRLRELLSVALDRATIASAIYQDRAQPSGGFYAGPDTFGYPDDLQAPAYNPERAVELMGELGYGGGQPLRVEIATYDEDGDFPMMPTLAEAIAGYYQAIGIEATVLAMDKSALRERMRNCQCLPGQPNADSVTPVTLFLSGFDNRVNMIPDQISGYTAIGREGRATWNNENLPEQQARLETLRGEFDPAKQEELFGDYLRWMAQNYNNIPVLASGAVFGLSSDVADWKPIVGRPVVNSLWTLQPAP